MVDVQKYFERRLRRYGDSSKTLDYSPESQRRRFEVFADIGDLEGRDVLDVGCGLGHLYDYLQERYRTVRYVGLDMSPRLLAKARERHKDVTFEVWDIVARPPEREADYVLASGVLNVEQGDNEAAMRRLLRHGFGAAKKGLAVNMLSTWADRHDRDRHYYDPGRMVRTAKKLTRWVQLRHDYLPHDFTLYLYREKQ